MNIDLFSKLDKLDIIHEDSEKQEQIIYSSLIESVNEQSMLILSPFCEELQLQSKVGDTIHIRATSEECAYFFEATFLGYRWNGISLWEVSLPLHVQRSQLREYVRVKISLDVKIEFIDEHLQHKIINTLTKDVSAGGLQIVMPVAPPADSKVMVLLSLADQTTLKVKGEFVRIKYPKTPAQKHFASIKFCELDKKLTNKIVKYIFDKQIEQRQKDRTLFT